METISLTARDLERVENPCPEFRSWAWNMLFLGNLETLVATVIRSGKAGDVPQALAYLNQFIGSQALQITRLGWTEIAGEPSTRILRLSKRFATLFHGEEPNSALADPCRRLGTLSHLVVPELLVGNLLALETTKPAPYAEQLGLFQEQLVFFNHRLRRWRRRLRRRSDKLHLIERIEGYVSEFAAALEARQGRAAMHMRRGLLRRFKEALRKVYGLQVNQVTGNIFEDEYYAFLTLLTWAQALLYYRNTGPQHLFREVRVLAPEQDLSGGRIDALEVTRIADSSPSDAQVRLLREMCRRRYRSVGHLIRELVGTFGELLVLTVKDWKFAIGDGPQGIREQILEPEEIMREPLAEHVEQLQRYLTLTMLSYHLLIGERTDPLWKSTAFRLRGELVYFFPHVAPVSHEVTLDATGFEHTFVELVVNEWESAEERTRLRRITGAVLGHAIELLGGSGPKSLRTTGLNRESSELLFADAFPRNKGAVTSLVQSYRPQPEFLDEDKIVEVIRTRRGGTHHLLHFNRLVAAIESGKLTASPAWNEARGGHVTCPVHSERTPSLHIWLETGTFKCFGCGIHGTLAQESLPEEIRLNIVRRPRAPRVSSATAKLVIPERHQKIMRLAQEILASCFRGSAGEDYMTRVRALDPELCSELGVGYGTTALVHNLLDQGFTYEELIFYGLLGISPRIRENGRLVRELLDRGMSLDELRRPVKVKLEKGKLATEVPGLPYSVLERRVTFPLSIGGIVNNFYGRDTTPDGDKRFRHRKLTRRHTGVEHGGFNMGAFNQTTGELIVTEGAIDAITLVKMTGSKTVVAMIGVSNTLLVEEIARFPGDITIALDYDEHSHTGQLNAVFLTERFLFEWRKLGTLRPGRKIQNFTAEFMDAHPHEPYKDPNDWWVRHHKPLPPAAPDTPF